MAYSGNVRPSGPADVRELPELVLTKISVGPMDNNAYLLRCRRSGAQVLVDAANEPGKLLDLVGDAGLDAVVTTHQHADHWQALDAVVEATGALVVAHALDADGLPINVDRFVDDDEEIAVGDTSVRVIHVAGHTPGGIVLVYDDPDGPPHMITGDSLFPGGVGKARDPRDFDRLITDVEVKLFGEYSDETWVYPGHGNDTNLGTERPHLDEWRERGW